MFSFVCTEETERPSLCLSSLAVTAMSATRCASLFVPRRPSVDIFQPYMDAIQDLSTLITQFKQAADAYSQLLSTRPVGDSKNPEPLHDIASCASDPLLQIASELSLSAQVKKAMKVIRNLSAVAFTVRLLIKVSLGCRIDILLTHWTILG